jgi:hypothetical protein
MASTTRARVVTFGLSESNMIRAVTIDSELAYGTTVTVRIAG